MIGFDNRVTRFMLSLALDLVFLVTCYSLNSLMPLMLSENDSNSTENQNKNSNLAIVPKTFVGNEMFDGKPVFFYLTNAHS